MVTEDLSAYLEVSLYSKGASRVSEVEVKRGSSTCSAGGYEHVTNFVTDDDAVQVRLPMIHVVDMRDGSRKSQRFKSLQRKSIRTMNDTIRRQRQAKRALAHRCLGKRDCGVMTATKRSELHAITTAKKSAAMILLVHLSAQVSVVNPRAFAVIIVFFLTSEVVPGVLLQNILPAVLLEYLSHAFQLYNEHE